MISQSFIKDMLAYRAGECGTYLEARNSGVIEMEPSDAMKLGVYFEYLVSGGLPRSGVVPEPVMTKTGLAAAYQYATSQAERVKTYIKRMGWKIVEVAPFIQNGVIEGHLDCICEDKAGNRFVLDLKYSGLVTDRWSERGWLFTESQTAYHAIQAVQYDLLTGLPFYYLVAESKQGGKVEVFYVDISDEARQRHAALVADAQEFEEMMAVGLEPRPEVTKCESCPLYESCNYRAIYPTIKTIKL